uniref:Uncharacterized protein n=1 Tax=Rhizophora mucronata TaxID=61149 RepID=A0A2P2QZ49_RHIMU
MIIELAIFKTIVFLVILSLYPANSQFFILFWLAM